MAVAALLLALLVLLCVQGIYQNTLLDFFETDFALYFRLLTEREHMLYAQPIVADALRFSPTWFMEIGAALVRWGFDPDRSAHYVPFLALCVALQIGCVVLAAYGAARGAGCGRAFAVIAVVLVFSHVMFTYYGRMFNLRSLTTTPYLSLVMNAVALAALGLYLSGQRLAAGALAGLACNLHAVTGPLAVLYIAAMEAVPLLRGVPLRDVLRRLCSYGAWIALFAAPFIFKVLLSPMPVFSGFDAAELFAYARHRSTNPFPLGDGLSQVLAQLTAIAAAYALTYADARFDRDAAMTRFRVLLGCLAASYVVQAFFTEVVQSTLVLSLVLHRLSPVIYLVLIVLLARGLQLLWERGEFAALAAAGAVLFLQCFRGLRLYEIELTHTERVFWYLFFPLLILARTRPALLRQIAPGGGVLLALAMLFSIVGLYYGARVTGASLGLGPAFALLGSKLRTGDLMQVALVAAACAVGALVLGRNPRGRAWLAHAALPWMLCAAFVGAKVHFGRTLEVPLSAFSGLPRFEERRPREAIELLQQHTQPRDVIFVAPPTDLEGVRQQFLDWRMDWYALYARNHLPSVVARMRSIGIELGPDSRSLHACRFPRRLLVERCVIEREFHLGPYYSDSLWLRYKDRMRAVEPALKYALFRVGNLPKCDGAQCEEVARNRRYVLYVLK
jgi:hypothetical protein